MFNSISILTTPGYKHHLAFQEVAEGLSAGFAELGHHVPITPTPRGECLILGANIAPHLVPDDATVFNLEVCTSGWLTPKYLACLQRHPVWDYSESNIKWLKAHDVDAKLCGIGYHECLTRIKPQEPVIDVLFYGSIFGRRIPILKAVEDSGLKVKTLFGVYGRERDECIARSKTVLNIHAYDDSPPEVVRLSYLYANVSCVVSEHEIAAGSIPVVLRELVVDACERQRWAESDSENFRQVRQSTYLGCVI